MRKNISLCSMAFKAMFASLPMILLLVNTGLASLADPGHGSGLNQNHIYIFTSRTEQHGWPWWCYNTPNLKHVLIV